MNCFQFDKNYICSNCLKNLNFRINFNCLECGRKIISHCQIKNHSKLIKFLISFNSSENKTLYEAILLGKKGAYEIFNDFGYYLGQELKKYNFRDYYLTFIPLTRKKLLERGFNQTEILAQAISQTTGLKIFSEILKIKETSDQAVLNYEQRLKNLQGSFSLKNKPPAKLILIDDLKTTGATLKECSRVLKTGGAKEIIALTILS